MSNQVIFNTAKEKHLEKLSQYVPVVSRVHGGSHPEFHKVREVFEKIAEKIKEAGTEKPNLDVEFAKLREVTDRYAVPNDVCESYEAVYNMLEEMDRAYHS
ncbi:MAG: iron-sulfur cluster repair di-iron protein, ric [Eubacteriales bacterium]|jgi:regulator of cell morphogenesis and NO signaling|nr:iron-sulfur cluster repair di-iron protein, ric [Eubacteriales bacterium]